MLDVVDQRGQHAFVDRGDPAFHLLRIEAGVAPAHGDDRNVDIRKNVGRGPQDDQRRGDQDEQRQDHEGVWSVQRKANNPHDEAGFPTFVDIRCIARSVRYATSTLYIHGSVRLAQEPLPAGSEKNLPIVDLFDRFDGRRTDSANNRKRRQIGGADAGTYHPSIARLNPSLDDDAPVPSAPCPAASNSRSFQGREWLPPTLSATAAPPICCASITLKLELYHQSVDIRTATAGGFQITVNQAIIAV